jgi:hypothetical protein
MITAKSTNVFNRPIPPRDERPICPQCGKRRFVFRYYDIDGRVRMPRSAAERKKGKFAFWKFQGPGFFCSDGCAADYANKHYQQSKNQNHEIIFSIPTT